MKKFVLTLLVLAVPLGLFAAATGGANDKTIYGDDDRLDLYQVKDPKIVKLADSTVGLFFETQVTIKNDVAALMTVPYAQSVDANLPLCKEERFYDQRVGAFCSGSLVAPDIIMTAGHCVMSDDPSGPGQTPACGDVRFVFGFSVLKEGDMPDHVPAGEVYSCAKVLGRVQEPAGADWALIKLDRPVVGHAPLGLSQTPIAKDAPVFVIGHPTGLPTKVAGGAKVRDASPSGFFVANTDTYGGNSGSAVFNAQTGLVEGILVRGDDDFVPKGNCMASKVCPNDGCSGESITKISSVSFPKADEPVAGHGLPAPARVAPVGKSLSALLESASSAAFDGVR